MADEAAKEKEVKLSLSGRQIKFDLVTFADWLGSDEAEAIFGEKLSTKMFNKTVRYIGMKAVVDDIFKPATKAKAKK